MKIQLTNHGYTLLPVPARQTGIHTDIAGRSVDNNLCSSVFICGLFSKCIKLLLPIILALLINGLAIADEITIYIEEESSHKPLEFNLLEWEGRVSLEKLAQVFKLTPVVDLYTLKTYISWKGTILTLGYQMEDVLVGEKIFHITPAPIFHDSKLYVSTKLIDIIVEHLLNKDVQWENEGSMCFVMLKREALTSDIYGIRDLDIDAWSMRTIFIDPGHGGSDFGAKGKSGLLEKDITLDIALALKETLVSKLGMKAITSRDADIRVPLVDRIEMANNLKAGCFISIHAGYAAISKVSGFEIAYYPDAGKFKNGDIELWENNQADYSEGSRILAYSIAYALEETFKGMPVRVTPFRGVTLIGALMPAVILEVGYLSNASDEANLLDRHFKDLIIEAIFKGIYNFKKDYEEILKRSEIR